MGMTYEQLVSPLFEFFNQGADKQLGSRKRDAQGNIEMTKWDHITGRTQAELNSAAAERLNNTGLADDYRRLAKTDAVPTDMRSGELRTKVAELQGIDDATKLYLRTPGNLGRAALSGMGEDEIYKAILDAEQREKDRVAREPGGVISEIEKRDQRYVDAINNQTAMQAFQMTQAQNNFKLQQDQLALQMRRDDMKEARTERQDRQQMILMLMKGLQNIGGSIAI